MALESKSTTTRHHQNSPCIVLSLKNSILFASLGICRDTNSSNMETESSLVVQLVTDDNAPEVVASQESSLRVDISSEVAELNCHTRVDSKHDWMG